jgi:hypothetical protein
MIDVETRIRERAHGIWEAEGRPAGRAEAHWHMAAAELFAAAPGKAATARRARAAADAPAPKRRTSKKLETAG